MLDVFSTEESLKCLAMNTHWGASKTQYSEVWIKSDLDAPTIANCIKEEMYNASGVPGDPIGLPSLFTPTEFSGEQLEPPLYESFSVRDRIVLFLIYDDRMQNGQSRGETVRLAREIIGEQCA